MSQDKILIKNQTLRKAFKDLNLSLDEVMDFYPQDLEIENRRLSNLLVFTMEYMTYGSQEAMESIGHHFPPVFPMISPENDWLRFEKWMKGEVTIQKFKDRLPDNYVIIPEADLSDEDLEDELKTVKKLLANTGYYMALNDGIPKRLEYQQMLDALEDEDMGGEGWHNDGCSGYCPGCIQRPWCESGEEMTWGEDEKAGKMKFPEELNKFVSAVPIPLHIIQEALRKDAERDAEIMRSIESDDKKNGAADNNDLDLYNISEN